MGGVHSGNGVGETSAGSQAGGGSWDRRRFRSRNRKILLLEICEEEELVFLDGSAQAGAPLFNAGGLFSGQESVPSLEILIAAKSVPRTMTTVGSRLYSDIDVGARPGTVLRLGVLHNVDFLNAVDWEHVGLFRPAGAGTSAQD